MIPPSCELWEDLSDDPSVRGNLEHVDWEEIHTRNFKCTIETKLRSFYFTIFHKAIALNNLLCKIERKESPMCAFCHNAPETIIRIFCDCEEFQPIWDGVISLIINDIFDPAFNSSSNNFDRLVGIEMSFYYPI